MLPPLEIHSARTLVLCEPQPFFARAAEEAGAELRAGLASLVPLAEPQGSWTARSLIEQSAFFTDLTRRAKNERIQEAFDAVGIERKESKRPHIALDVTTRRRALLAAALLVRPSRVILEDPLLDLDDAAAEAHANFLVRALGEIRWLIFASTASWWSPLVRAASEILIFKKGAIAERGTAVEIARASKRVRAAGTGDHDAFVKAARSRGFSARPILHGVEIEWAEGDRRAEIFEIANECSFAIDEITPLVSGLV